MSRKRYISTDISVDKKVRMLSDSAALFYTWMIPHCEENATLTSDPDELSAIIVPNRSGWSSKKVAAILTDIELAGLIMVLNGTVYFPPESFYRHQSHIAVERRRQEQPAQNPCKTAMLATSSNNQQQVAQNSASSSSSSSVSSSKSIVSRKPDTALAVFDYWRERCNHPGAVLSPDRRAKIDARLREGATVERLCQAIDGCAGSKFHMGDNDQGRRYDSIELIFRNAGKVDEFAELATYRPGEKPPDPRAKRTRIANAREALEAGNEDAARVMCKPDEWAEVIGRPI